MKKWGQVALIFVLMMGIAYFKPVLFDEQKKAPTVTSSSQPVQPVNQKEEVLPATGFASYINQPVKKLRKDFGTYQARYAMSQNAYWEQYQSQSQWFQALIKQDKVVAILVIGEQEGLTPLDIGSNISVLSAKVDLPTKIDFSYNHKSYKVELNEDEMQMNPVVRFKNKTYAMLQMDYQGNLAAVFYVSPEELLLNMPYHLLQGQSLMQTITMSEANLSQFMTQTLDRIHPQFSHKELTTLNNEASRLLLQFKTQPDRYIKRDEVQQNWNDITHHNGSVHDVVFSNDVTNRLLEQSSLPKGSRIILFATTHQLNWEIVNRYYEYRLFDRDNIFATNLQFGLATDGTNVLMILTPEEETK